MVTQDVLPNDKVPLPVKLQSSRTADAQLWRRYKKFQRAMG